MNPSFLGGMPLFPPPERESPLSLLWWLLDLRLLDDRLSLDDELPWRRLADEDLLLRLEDGEERLLWGDLDLKRGERFKFAIIIIVKFNIDF